jgi:hypothetical protein
MDKCVPNPSGPEKDRSLKIRVFRNNSGQEFEDDTADLAFETTGQTHKLTIAFDGDKSATLSQENRILEYKTSIKYLSSAQETRNKNKENRGEKIDNDTGMSLLDPVIEANKVLYIRYP